MNAALSKPACCKHLACKAPRRISPVIAASTTKFNSTAPSVVRRVLQFTATTAAGLLLAGSSFANVPETTQPGYNSGFLTDEEVDLRREELNFTRAYDGKVAIKSKNSDEYYDVKLDLKSPGTVLLRDQEGQVYYISFAALKQVDLSDDEIVAALAMESWEKDINAVEDKDDKGQLQKLELTREGFYNLVSLVEP